MVQTNDILRMTCVAGVARNTAVGWGSVPTCLMLFEVSAALAMCVLPCATGRCRDGYLLRAEMTKLGLRVLLAHPVVCICLLHAYANAACLLVYSLVATRVGIYVFPCALLLQTHPMIGFLHSLKFNASSPDY